MRSGSRFLFRVSVCAGLVLSPMTALCGNTNVHSKFVGVYQSRLSAGPMAGPSMNLSLGPDGSATVTEDAGNGTRTLFGHWVDSGNQVLVTFDAAQGNGAEPPMAFQSSHDGLQAVTWNHAAWGKANPPLMKKGGAKVKEHYWFTQNP
ncbi:MAG: hypothetical protein QOJ51_6478 [Acidobacteriaceae bacterium]|jgi:hypothetical protein|nr:hypothetical protein [Acidobacteriaceae bacterium]